MGFKSTVKKDGFKLFLTFFLLFSYNTTFFTSSSEHSRFAMTRAIVERGDFIIDDYYEKYPDYYFDSAYFNGHHYSDKAPAISFIATPVYMLLAFASLNTEINVTSEVSGFVGLESSRSVVSRPFVAEYLIIILTTCVVSSSLIVLIYNFIKSRSNKGVALLVTLIYGFSTKAFAYSSSLNDIQFAAFFLFASIYMINKSKYLPAGVFMGMLTLTIYYGIVAVMLVAIYYLFESKDKRMFYSIIPVVLSLCIFAWYNLSTTGNPFVPIVRYHLHYGGLEESYGFLLPSVTNFMGLMFGPKGLFTISPIILISVLGLLYMKDRKLRNLIVVLLLVYVSIFSSFFTYMARYMGFLLPLLILPIWPLVERKRNAVLFFALLSFSLVFLCSIPKSYDGLFALEKGILLLIEGKSINALSSLLAYLRISIGNLSLLPPILLLLLWKSKILPKKRVGPSSSQSKLF